MRRLVATTVLGVIMLVATMIVAVISSGMPTDDGFDPWFIAILFAGLWLYWALGAVVVVRADGHVVGWLFAVAAAMMASVFGSFALVAILVASQPPDPLGLWSPLVGGLLFFPGSVTIGSGSSA